MKLETSPKLRRFVLAFMFCVMLYANFLTPKVVDDWTYGFSFATGAPISSLGDILPSMRVHSQVINGRLFAHFLVQVFEFLPKGVFNVLNAAVYTALLWLLYRLSRGEEDSNLLLAAITGAVWVFTPAFGQVFLWLDGSCNYGWGSCLMVLWLLPYTRGFLAPGKKRPVWKTVLWCALGFFAGGYLENISASGIFLALILLLLTRFYKKKKTGAAPWLALLSAGAGFLFLLTRPAEHLKGGETGSLTSLGSSFIAALNAYRKLEILVFFFAVAFVLCCLERTSRDRRILSLSLLAASLAGNFMITFAAYYPERCLVFPALLLTAGCAVLAADLLRGARRAAVLCAFSALLVSFVYNGIFGLADVTNTYMSVRENERIVFSERDRGAEEVRLPLIDVYTKYSPLYDLKYLDTEDAASWPNGAMAKALGVKSILGYEEED